MLLDYLYSWALCFWTIEMYCGLLSLTNWYTKFSSAFSLNPWSHKFSNVFKIENVFSSTLLQSSVTNCDTVAVIHWPPTVTLWLWHIRDQLWHSDSETVTTNCDIVTVTVTVTLWLWPAVNPTFPSLSFSPPPPWQLPNIANFNTTWHVGRENS